MTTAFRFIGHRITPKSITSNKELLKHAGFTKIPFHTFGLIYVMGIFLVVYCSATVFFFIPKQALIINFMLMTVLVLVFSGIFYVAITIFLKEYLKFQRYKRTKEVERIWPDFLDGLIISLGSGMTFHESIINSLDESFGALEEEMEILVKKVLLGEDYVKAFKEFEDQFNSNLITETVSIIDQGIVGGMSLKEVLRKLNEDLRISRNILKENKANVSTYVIFLNTVAVLVAPFLFAISSNLFNTLIGFSEEELAANLVQSINDIFSIFIWVTLAIINIFSGAIVSSLQNKTFKEGAGKILLFIIVSILIFEIAFRIMTVLFGAIA